MNDRILDSVNDRLHEIAGRLASGDSRPANYEQGIDSDYKKVLSTLIHLVDEEDLSQDVLLIHKQATATLPIFDEADVDAAIDSAVADLEKKGGRHRRESRVVQEQRKLIESLTQLGIEQQDLVIVARCLGATDIALDFWKSPAAPEPMIIDALCEEESMSSAEESVESEKSANSIRFKAGQHSRGRRHCTGS
ncbi:hypothetical protein GCM10022226_13320 [Sphaerisporangium flaviroseum]|uniref:Uncharacterized protein n=1 Tax=Sphaerisporangium flaviroseum TaxID=509199 RepID=A0ABP7HKI4_9ACTN